MEKSTQTYTFKVYFGEQIRRIQMEHILSFNEFQASIRSHVENIELEFTWQDDEGDFISMKHDQDLQQCLKFHEQVNSKSVKIYVKQPQHPTVTISPSSTSAQTFKQTPFPNTYLNASSQPTRCEQSCLKYGEVCTEYCQQYGCKNKIFKVIGKVQKELARVKSKPDFDEAEFQRQLTGFQALNLPTGPFAQLLLAKNIVKMNKKQRKWAQKGSKHWKCGKKSYISCSEPNLPAYEKC